MAQLVGISGSLRRASLNGMLLRAASEAVPAGSSLEVGSIRGVPLYDGDAHASEGIPPAVCILKDLIANADGLLLVTPEYNHSIPGVFKNAIDWLSRPSTDIARVFKGRPVALMGAAAGRSGTALAQEAWLPVLRALQMRPWFGPPLLVSDAARAFDAEGRLIDDALRQKLAEFMAGFAEFGNQVRAFKT